MSKFETVKTHVQTHKTVYIVGAVCLTVGVLGGVALTKRASTISVDPKINQFMSWKPNATLEVHIEALGDPGNIIQDVTTGTVYASQGQAAKAVGASASQMSRHLSGATNWVNGHQFVKLGKALVSDVAE